MKYKKLISLGLLPFLLAGLASVAACSGKSSGGKTSGGSGLDTKYSDLPTAPSGSLGNETFTLGDFRLEFYSNKDNTKGVRIVEVDSKSVMFKNDKPCDVFIKTEGKSTSIKADEYTVGYKVITKTNYGFVAEGKILLDEDWDSESTCWVVDAYSSSDEAAFDVRRTIYLKTCKMSEDTGAYGMRSRFVMYAQSGSSTVGQGGDYDMFVPSQLYRDDAGNSPNGFLSGLGSTTTDGTVLETWAGLPMSMLREVDTGFGMAIVHKDIDISCPETGLTSVNKISDEYNFGSVGFAIKGGAGVEFCYPSIAAPKSGSSMSSGSGTTCYWHELYKGKKETYNVSLIPSSTPDMEDGYNKAMVHSYTAAMRVREPYIADQSVLTIGEVYANNVQFLSAKKRAYGTGFNYTLLTGNIKNAGNIEFGFIGMGPQLGNQLLDFGINKGNSTYRSQGEDIVNNWVNGGYDKLPHADRNCDSGSAGSYPSFIRIVADGMDGVLDAYLEEKKAGVNKSNWYNFCTGVANNLVSIQNSDGSFYRCYETNGNKCTRTSGSPDQYKGSSLYNTPTIVRFLVRMYELTGTLSYKDAALKAARWSYNNLYLGLHKFVGGACDNPDVVDKESTLYGLYCFNSVYMIETNEEWKQKFLDAAEYAACSFMSWTLTTEFACVISSTPELNCMKEGNTSGFSFIATGNAACDNYSAFGHYEMFRIYIMTGNEAYLTSALLIQQNTKLSTNYDNRMNWGGWKSLGPEATTISEFEFSTVDSQSGGAWLPWNGAACTDPISRTRHAYGSDDLYDVIENNSFEELQEKYLAAKNSGSSYVFA